MVDIEPHLDGHHIQSPHQMLVVQSAQSPQENRDDGIINPLVVRKPDSLLFTGRGEHIKRSNGKCHTHPLVKVQPLTKYQHRPDQSQDRLRRFDRSGNGQRQVLQGKVTKYPRREDNDRLDEYGKMTCKETTGT